ncbi:MAG: outer membrane protein assembly factor BamC [Pseudomonadota bacterium]
MYDRITTLFVLLAAMLATGCSSMNVDSVLPDRQVEYKKSKQAQVDLEVPPDLSSGTIESGAVMAEGGTPAVTTYSEFAGQQSETRPSATGGAVLPKNPDMTIQRDGQQRWLTIAAPPDAVWENVLDFWRENGILLMEQDPVAGVMRTTWIENRADIKSDFITNFLRSTLDSLYSSGTRDQFRVRLERDDSDTATELYLSHYRMEERLVSQTGAADVDRHIWVPKGSDPELEAIMLQRIMTHMGVSEARAKELAKVGGGAPQRRSQLVSGGGGDVPHLVIKDDFARSWRLVGIALDRVGFSVEDRDRSKGFYYVRYNDPSSEQSDQEEGLLSKLAFWSDSEPVDSGSRYVIALEESGGATRARVLNEQQQPESSETARRILGLIHEQIR